MCFRESLLPSIGNTSELETPLGVLEEVSSSMPVVGPLLLLLLLSSKGFRKFAKLLRLLAAE